MGNGEVWLCLLSTQHFQLSTLNPSPPLIHLVADDFVQPTAEGALAVNDFAGGIEVEVALDAGRTENGHAGFGEDAPVCSGLWRASADAK